MSRCLPSSLAGSNNPGIILETTAHDAVVRGNDLHYTSGAPWGAPRLATKL